MPKMRAGPPFGEPCTFLFCSEMTELGGRGTRAHLCRLRGPAFLGYRRRENCFELLPGYGLRLEKLLGHRIKLTTVLFKQTAGQLVGLLDNLAHFFVDLLSYGFGVVTLLGDLTAKEDEFLLLTVLKRSKLP